MRFSSNAILALVLAIALFVPIIVGVGSGLVKAKEQNSLAAESNKDPVEIDLSLSETKLALSEGETKQVKAIMDKDPNSYVFQWQSADTDVVTVSRSSDSAMVGEITAVAKGDTKVTLNLIDKTQFTLAKSITIDVKVLPAAKEINIYLDKSSTALVPEDIITNATDVTWSSEDESVATVSDGVITAHKTGHVYLIATSGDLQNKVLVNVYETVLKFESNFVELVAGTENNAIDFVGNLGEEPVWEISDEEVVYRNEDGSFTAKQIGLAKLTLTSSYDGQVTECIVIVKSGEETTKKLPNKNKAEGSKTPFTWFYTKEDKVSTSGTEPVMDNGVIRFGFTWKEENPEKQRNVYLRYQPDVQGDVFYKVTLYIYSDTNGSVEISSYNSAKETPITDGINVFKINDYKSAVSGSSAPFQIKFKTAGNYIVVPVMEVTRVTPKIHLDKTFIELSSVGSTETINSTIYGADSSAVQWSSSDPEVATVDANGTITAVTSGYVNVTATAGDLKATCLVRVGEVSGTNLSSQNKDYTIQNPGNWFYLVDEGSSVHKTPTMTSDGDIHLLVKSIGAKYVYLRYQPTDMEAKYKAIVTITYLGEGEGIVEVSGGSAIAATNKLSSGTTQIEYEFDANETTPFGLKFKTPGAFVVNVIFEEITEG